MAKNRKPSKAQASSWTSELRRHITGAQTSNILLGIGIGSILGGLIYALATKYVPFEEIYDKIEESLDFSSDKEDNA